MTSYILDAAGDKVFFSSLPMAMIFKFYNSPQE